MKFINMTLSCLLTTVFLVGCGSVDTTTSKNNSNNNSEQNTQHSLPTTQNGIYSYKNLQWQDDGKIEGNRVQYKDIKTYCQQLTLGGFDDWRLPTIKEFEELNEVKDKLNFSWSNDNYIYWTADETTISATGKDIIRMYNLSQGKSLFYYVDKLDNYGWSERCVRGGTKDSSKDNQNDTSTSSQISDIFQSYQLSGSKATSSIYFQNEGITTLNLSNQNNNFNYGGSNYEVIGSYEMPNKTTINNGDTLLVLKDTADNLVYKITYLGAYKTNNIFVRVEKPIMDQSYISIMHKYSGNHQRILQEADDNYGGIEQMYQSLFKTN